MTFEPWQQFVTPVGILRYADLFAPKAWPAKAGEAPKEPKFSATLLVEPAIFTEEDKAAWAAMQAYAIAAGENLFPAKRDSKGNPVPHTGFADLVKLKALKWPFRNALEKADKDGFTEGRIFFAATAKANRRLDIVGTKRQPLEEKDVYPGCIGRLVVGPYAYDQGGGRGVALGLYGFQKLRDGDPFAAGAGASCAGMFGEVEDFVGTATDPSDFLGI